MKKGDHFFLVQVAEGSEKYNECTRKRDVLDYVAYRKDKLSQGPIGRIIAVQMVGEWEIEQVALLVPRVEDEEPNNIGKNPKECCIDIRCLDGDPHHKEDCPHKDEDIPCEDEHCPVIGPHTVYNCHLIPRCHNPNCKAEQGAHWTKDCKHMEWKDIDTTPRGCTNSKCAMPLADREKKCMRSSCPKYE